MRGKWLLFGGCLILLAIAAGAITVWRREQAKPAAVAAPAPSPVEVSGDLSLSGKVEARNVVAVKPPSAGTVEEYLVNEGEEVYEGQLLARLNNPTLTNEQLQAKERADKAQERVNQLESQMLAARLEVSRGRAEAARVKDEYTRADRAYQRQTMLNQQGATPRLAFEKAQKEFESAKLDYESSTARQQIAEGRITDLARDIDAAKKTLEERNNDLEDADASLQATQVHAPVDGLVIQRKGDAGVEIQLGEDDLFQIATDLGNLQVVAEVNEEQQKKIKEGSPAAVYLSELGNEPMTGEVARVADGRVTVLFQNPNPLVKPGLKFLETSLIELITQTATNLPPDVRKAMGVALEQEKPDTQASQALNIIANNIDMAVEDEGPICQDTGMPTFVVHTPVGVSQIAIKKAIKAAVAEATKRGKLRPNSVDSLTGKNSGDNLGVETPVIHWEQWEEDDIEVKLILKGGGCENKNIQYSLPTELEHLGKAGRNIEGVKKCLLHAVWQAQGQGCAPGAIGVCIGSDRAHGYYLAKHELFRELDDVNPDPVLAQLETEVMEEANKIGVGPMGFGGNVSLIGCKVMAANRLPASFFVSVAYDCWAYRRLGVRLDANTGAINKWLYRDPEREVEKLSKMDGFPLTGREVTLTPPLTEAQMRSLHVGDVVIIRGDMYTGRDAVHARLMNEPPPVSLDGQILYHCGPVMLKNGEQWVVKAAGPTTSSREEPYQAEVLRRYGVRAVIGKGGMGAKTSKGLQECGAVYLNGIGGAAQFYARTLKKVKAVHWLELGIPEAMWHLEADGFVAIVTMDAHGNSLHADVEKATGELLAALQK